MRVFLVIPESTLWLGIEIGKREKRRDIKSKLQIKIDQ